MSAIGIEALRPASELWQRERLEPALQLMSSCLVERRLLEERREKRAQIEAGASDYDGNASRGEGVVDPAIRRLGPCRCRVTCRWIHQVDTAMRCLAEAIVVQLGAGAR